MSQILKPDICVIGAGSGGLTVAAASAAFGVDVVLVEKGKMGGDCLNYGCVPSKALIAAGKKAHMHRIAPTFGVSGAAPTIDFQRVHDHVHEVIAAIEPNDSVERFTGLGVNVIQEAAVFTDANTVQAGDHTIKARRFVVATGSSAAVPPIPGLDSVPYLTNETLFDLTEGPQHLIIIGGGPIGLEMAQAHRRLGAEVTVLEAFAPLGAGDPEMAEIVLTCLREEGIDIRAGAKVSKVSGQAGAITVTIESADGESQVTGTHLLVAAGRAANVDGLGLEAAGIAYSAKGIKVDDALRTTNRRVLAIGDVAGGPQFTHVAGYHGALAVQSILSPFPAKQNLTALPWVTFTDPEYAHVGLSEAEAAKRHGDIRVLRWPFTENDRAQAERKTRGHIKVITDKKGRILGADVVGEAAGEIINMWALALSQKMKIGAFRGYISPYPTLAEVGKRAAVTYYAGATANPLLRRIIRFILNFK